MESRVYCLRCCNIVGEEEAGTVFRTGYYKVTIKLGFCSSCADPAGPEAAAAAAVLDGIEAPSGEGGELVC